MKKIIKSLIFPVIILVITLSALFPLFSNQLLYSDDAELHAARVANYYLAIKQNQIPPRWAPNLDSGYGSPVFNFTYPLPYMISSVIYMALPINIVTSLNLTIILLTTLGVTGAYFTARKFSLSQLRSTIAAILYLSAPYTLINIYSRTALGEISFFSFLPWMMWSIEHFIRDKKIKFYIPIALVISLSLLILSHQTSALITLPILAIYYLTRIEKNKQRMTLIKRTLPLFITSIILTAWYWLPALIEKQFIILDRADTITNYLTQFPKRTSFFFHNIIGLDRLNTFKLVSVSYSFWMLFFSSLWIGVKNKKAKTTWFLLLISLLILILMMPFTRPIWLVSGLGNYIQYPWRLLSVLTLTSLLMYLHLIKQKKYWLDGVLVIISTVAIFTYAQPRGFQSWSDYELLEYFKTTTTFNEFQPIWAAEYTRNFPKEKLSFRNPQQQLYEDEVIHPVEGVSYEIDHWLGSTMSYEIQSDESIEVIQKTYYFPGWKLNVNNQPQKIIYQDNEFPGHITYHLNPGKHQIKLNFTQDTKPRKIASYLFLLGIISLVIYYFPQKKTK